MRASRGKRRRFESLHFQAMASRRPRKPVNPTRRRNRRAEAAASPSWSLDPPGLDEANRLVSVAEGFDGERARELTTEALGLSPDCALAHVLLAELSDDADAAEEQYRQGIAAGEWALGEAAIERHMGELGRVVEAAGYLRARRGLVADNAVVASLVVLFAVASPIVSFPVSFCGWHSLRGLQRLRRERGESWPELARSLAALTVGAIALVALASWLVLGGAGWNGTLIRVTFVGLSAVAVPHLLLHGVAPLCEAFATRRPSSLQLKPRMTVGCSA